MKNLKKFMRTIQFEFKVKGDYLFDPSEVTKFSKLTKEIAKQDMYHNDGTAERIYPDTLDYFVKKVSKLKYITTIDINKILQKLNLLPLKYEYLFDNETANIKGISGVVYENTKTKELMFGRKIINIIDFVKR